MELTQLLRVGLGLAVGLNAQYSHPVCITRELEHSHNNQQLVGIHRNVGNRNFTNMGNTCTRNFLTGMSEVQTYGINQSHNDDVTGMNRQHTDGLNEQVTEDDVMNVKR